MKEEWREKQGSGKEEEEQNAGMQEEVADGGVVPSYFSQLSKWLPELANILLLCVLPKRTSNYRAAWSTLIKIRYFSMYFCFTYKHGFLSQFHLSNRQ